MIKIRQGILRIKISCRLGLNILKVASKKDDHTEGEGVGGQIVCKSTILQKKGFKNNVLF